MGVRERRISAKQRNKLLVIAFLLLLLDCAIALAFALMSPTDTRTSGEYVSRKQAAHPRPAAYSLTNQQHRTYHTTSVLHQP